MPAQTLFGQDLHDLVLKALGGYQNAVDVPDILAAINEGKDKLWMVLKNLRDDYFLVSSQTGNNAGDDYFPALTTNAREFTLPKNLRELKAIEVTGPSGFEGVRFEKLDMSDPRFLALRHATNADPSLRSDCYYYDVVGTKTLILSHFPEAALVLKLWYVYWIPDLDVDTEVADILQPWVKNIVTYAAKKLVLSLQDESLTEQWRQEWRQDVIDVAQSASPREIGEPVFVRDFEG